MKESNGTSYGMGIIWNAKTTNIKIIISNSNWMGSTLSSNKHNLQLILINVYGPIQTLDKWKFWDDISTFIELYHKENMIIGGDFNAILDLKEKF